MNTPYSIYAESTPNPKTMKFVSNKYVITSTTSYDFPNIDAATKGSPLAKKLFEFPFVTGVFISENIISISKSDNVTWQDVTPDIRNFLTQYLSEGNIVINTENITSEDNTSTLKEEVKPTVITDLDKKIVELLDQYIRPAVQSDGGAIDFVSHKEGIVTVQLRGSCSGCPSSTVTLKQGIESLLKNMLPEIKEVVAMNA